MTIKIGTTRIVLLVGNRAVKIATIRPLRLLFRLITLPFSSRRNRDRFSEKYGDCLLQALWNYFSAGLHANRAEYKYYQDNPNDTRVMPTIECRLHGLIIIQPRGMSVTEKDLREGNPFASLLYRCVEMNQPWQFCRHLDRRIVLVDYGRDETIKVLRSSNITAS